VTSPMKKAWAPSLKPQKIINQRHYTKYMTLWMGLLIVGICSFAGLLAPIIAPNLPNEMNLTDQLQNPSLNHLFGTDEFGRDIFSRVVYALRLDLWVVAVITLVPLLVGLLIGASAGFFGGKIDVLITRAIDICIAFPLMVLVIAVIAITGPGLTGVFIGVLGVGWVMYAQIARAEMLVLRNQQFVMAAQALGYSSSRTLFRHALPNLWRSNIVFSSSDAVLNMLLLSGLSYLGLGVQAPTAELGSMVAGGQQYLVQAWWVATIPGLVILFLGIGLSMVGDGLADRLSL